MRIFLAILLVLAVLITLLCVSGVVVAVSFRDGKFDWCVRYCGFRIFPRPRKEGGTKKKKEKKEKETEEPRKEFLMDKLWKKLQSIVGKMDMAGSALYALPGPLKRLFRGISWYAIETDFLIGGEDAADCAVLYGRVQSLLQPLLANSGNIMKVKRKKVAIACDFTADACRWDFACRFRIRVGTLLAVGIGFVWNYFMDSKKAGRQTSGVKL